MLNWGELQLKLENFYPLSPQKAKTMTSAVYIGANGGDVCSQP